MKIYGLVAKGAYANFSGTGKIHSQKMYRTEEEAYKQVASFLNKCCDGSLGALDITSTQVYVVDFDLED